MPKTQINTLKMLLQKPFQLLRQHSWFTLYVWLVSGFHKGSIDNLLLLGIVQYVPLTLHELWNFIFAMFMWTQWAVTTVENWLIDEHEAVSKLKWHIIALDNSLFWIWTEMLLLRVKCLFILILGIEKETEIQKL